MMVLIIRKRLTGSSPGVGPVATISIIIRRRVRIRKSPSPSLAVQPFLQAVNFQLHGSSILFMREVTSTSRLAPTSMRSMHTNLPVPPSLKVEELILTLGTNKLLPVLP